MELYGITNFASFDEQERYHIRTLHKRKRSLEQTVIGKGHTGMLKSDELRALEWIFDLLDEVSEDENETSQDLQRL